ncbi:sugar transferase [Helicobacter sp.]|nr:sugar transferase [Helicobacter sp.]MBD5165594.1 sugar transferase [Helicobacter sp.]
MKPENAVERVKNHLAYKLGQEMIKSSQRGGGTFI